MKQCYIPLIVFLIVFWCGVGYELYDESIPTPGTDADVCANDENCLDEVEYHI